MQAFLAVLQYLFASVVLGAYYGTLAGAAYGGIMMAYFEGSSQSILFGVLFGAFLGTIGGIVFGILGGTIGGKIGWCYAGFVGGLISVHIPYRGPLSDSSNWLPAIILATIGLFIACTPPEGSDTLPFTPWWRKRWHRAYPLYQILPLRAAIALPAFLLSIVFVLSKLPFTSGATFYFIHLFTD